MTTTRFSSILLLCVILHPLYGQSKQSGKEFVPSSLVGEYVNRFNTADEELSVQLIPIPAGIWDYFCLENVLYKGHTLTILYDKSGKKYKRRKGLLVFVDGVLKEKSDKIEKLSVVLG
ncbi:MAG: hypothetical protein LBG80_07650 [Bacteroidales bacterium]|jgi:hypothetical protein|nr:hypothetical protein [Bacteroidales bacterium]